MDYLGASLSRVSEVVEMLGLRLQEDGFLPGGEFSLMTLFKRLSSVGLTGNSFGDGSYRVP